MTGDKELLAQSKKMYFEVSTVELCFPSHCGKNDQKLKLMKLAGNLLTQLCKTSSGADLLPHHSKIVHILVSNLKVRHY